MKLLFIEDDSRITTALMGALKNDHDIEFAPNGSLGLRCARANEYDVIVLDLQLPDMSGLDVCVTLRSEGLTTPVLILSGESQVRSKINLLDSGADDYLTKPFSLGELNVRLRALKRRASKQDKTDPVLKVGDLLLDRPAMRVERAGKELQLRRKEFLLLQCLMEHAGAVTSRDKLGAYAWHGSREPWTNTIDVHIKYLRDKVDRPFNTKLIKTVHGMGYKISSET